MEIIKPRVSFENIGGLDALKTWITKRKNAFGPEAAAFGVPVQKGVVLFGVQGAGKSIISQAIACEMNRPMLRLDMGRLFSGLVGSSEANVRAVIAQVEAFGPLRLADGRRSTRGSAAWWAERMETAAPLAGSSVPS